MEIWTEKSMSLCNEFQSWRKLTITLEDEDEGYLGINEDVWTVIESGWKSPIY